MLESNFDENACELENDNNSCGTYNSELYLDTSDSENFTYTDFVDKKKRASEDENVNENNKKIKIKTITNNNDNININDATIIQFEQDLNGCGEKKDNNDTLVKYITDLRNENRIYFQKIMKQINGIKQTINTLQTQILDIKTNVTDVYPNIPEKPCETRDEFIEFDKSLTDDEIKSNLAKIFARCGGDDVGHFIKINLRKLMTDQVANSFCWSGTDNKMSVKKFNSILLIKKVCLSTLKFSTETSIDYHIKRYFQYAKQRIYLATKSN